MKICRFVLLLLALFPVGLAAAGEATPATYPMAVGVDDAGRPQAISRDPVAQAAYDAIGFKFLVYHYRGRQPLEEIEELTAWASRARTDFFLNQENTIKAPVSDPAYLRPGNFFRPGAQLMQWLTRSPHFRGVIYDEAEHWALNGVWVTGGGDTFEPHFHDAEGETLAQAYAGNLHNLEQLLRLEYPGLAGNARQGRGPVVAFEPVFPILFHLFARAGIAPFPKYLKETVTPVHAAMALGAARQYQVPYGACLDLWHRGKYPGHTPEELRSALLFAYWTGADQAYIENFNFRDSLYRATPDGGFELTDHGRVARDFIKDYLPANPRRIRHADFAPEIVIVRFPDSDWGQVARGKHINGRLYGATNLMPDAQTREWIGIWHVLTHGQLPARSLNYNCGMDGFPRRYLFPANNVAVYDHLAADPALFSSARLVFLTGKEISPQCLATLEQLVRQEGLCVTTPPRLAPERLRSRAAAPFSEIRDGKGCWILTEDVTHPEVARRLGPFLGRPDQLRYVFGRTEVVFTQSDPAGTVVVHGVERGLKGTGQ